MKRFNTIGERLAYLRGNRTQKEVCEALGISISALSMYETNMRIPRDSVKIRLADYYNVSILDLFYFDK